MMSKYDVIPPDVKKNYNDQLVKHDIRRVPGHYPVLMTKEEVDKFINMSIQAFDDAFGEEAADGKI